MRIEGIVNARLEAILRLPVRGPSGVVIEVNAILDTGYTGSLTLLTAVVTSLGLERRSGIRVVLADSSSRILDTFAVEVGWGGSWRNLVVSALETEPLVGMGLLAGHDLQVKVVPQGTVVITA